MSPGLLLCLARCTHLAGMHRRERRSLLHREEVIDSDVSEVVRASWASARSLVDSWEIGILFIWIRVQEIFCALFDLESSVVDLEHGQFACSRSLDLPILPDHLLRGLSQVRVCVGDGIVLVSMLSAARWHRPLYRCQIAAEIVSLFSRISIFLAELP